MVSNDNVKSQTKEKETGIGLKKDVCLKCEFDVVNSNSETKFFDRLKWINTKEAALYLRVSVGQIRNMVWRGQLPSYRMSNRLRFLKTDLDKVVMSPLERRNHD